MSFRREMVNLFDFIDEWRMEPCLWNDQAEGYRDKAARLAALKRLAEKFDMNEWEAKAKTRNLRTSFTKELKSEKSAQEKGILYRPTWQYFNALRFLSKHITHKSLNDFSIVEGDTQNHASSEDATSNPDHHEHSANNTTEDSEHAVPESSSAKRNLTTEHNRRKRKSRTNEREKEDEGNSFQNRLRFVDRREEDADDVFGRHIAFELRNIADPQAKQLAKVQIQNILYEVQFGDLPIFANQEDS